MAKFKFVGDEHSPKHIKYMGLVDFTHGEITDVPDDLETVGTNLRPSKNVVKSLHGNSQFKFVESAPKKAKKKPLKEIKEDVLDAEDKG